MGVYSEEVLELSLQRDHVLLLELVQDILFVVQE